MLTTILFLTSNAQAGGAGLPADPNTIGFHAFNLFLLLALLTWLLRSKIRDALANRSARVKREIDDSNQLRKEAQTRFAELEARLSGFEGELSNMREEAETAATKEREAIMARAEEDAARITESAERTIRDETERARQALRREVANLSIDIARERLEKQVSADDQKRLAKDFVDTVKSDNSGVTNG